MPAVNKLHRFALLSGRSLAIVSLAAGASRIQGQFL